MLYVVVLIVVVVVYLCDVSLARTHRAVLQPHADVQEYLLPPLEPEYSGKKCLVLDLDETLVHSSFKVRLTLGSLSTLDDNVAVFVSCPVCLSVHLSVRPFIAMVTAL